MLSALATLIPSSSTSKTCTVIVGAIGSWTLPGMLSVLASVITIIVGVMQAYDWIKANRKPPYHGEGE